MMNDIPETLETLQQAEYWHGWLMTAGLDLSDPAGYDRARKRFYKALQACNVQWAHDDATNAAIDQMLRDTRASVLFSHTDGDTVERGEYTLTVQTEYDYDAGTPWEQCEGHGPVSEWTTRDKRPGEIVLSSDRHNKRYYDYAEACRIALRDNWGFSPGKLVTARNSGRVWHAWFHGVQGPYGTSAIDGTESDAIKALHESHRATMTPRQYAAAAAMSDYEYLRSWCNDQWHYVGVIVTVTDADGNEVACESLWGLQSDDKTYLLELAEELAQQALDGLE